MPTTFPRLRASCAHCSVKRTRCEGLSAERDCKTYPIVPRDLFQWFLNGRGARCRTLGINCVRLQARKRGPKGKRSYSVRNSVRRMDEPIEMQTGRKEMLDRSCISCDLGTAHAGFSPWLLAGLETRKVGLEIPFPDFDDRANNQKGTWFVESADLSAVDGFGTQPMLPRLPFPPPEHRTLDLRATTQHRTLPPANQSPFTIPISNSQPNEPLLTHMPPPLFLNPHKHPIQQMTAAEVEVHRTAGSMIDTMFSEFLERVGRLP